jgi:hypothetical protein
MTPLTDGGCAAGVVFDIRPVVAWRMTFPSAGLGTGIRREESAYGAIIATT